MNSLFLQFGVASWKPLVTALLLPPVPFLCILLLGGRLIAHRRRTGWLTFSAGTLLVWLSCCSGASELIAPVLLPLPAALTPAQINGFRAQAQEPVAIIVLGGGVEEQAPEYGNSSLTIRSLERLRYGIWLSRKTGWPMGFSGGVGWGQSPGGHAAEALVAQRIATEEFGQPLRWVEAHSRDTRENAINTVKLLKLAGVRRVLLVTHVWHMPRALRNFQSASAGTLSITPAPISLSRPIELTVLQWMPSGEGLTDVRQVLREWLGGLAGA